MGLMGRYIDGLPEEARDRLIRAQDWCVAGVRGDGGSRCLVGHAEDWLELAVEDAAWRGWMGDEAGAPTLPAPDAPAPASELDLLCRPELFAFRRARPADLEVYRERLLRWGSVSESRIGSRFDRLCARRGLDVGVRMVKRRAGRAFAIDLAAPPRQASGRANGGAASRTVLADRRRRG